MSGLRRQIANLALILALLLAVAACTTLGPDYEEPAISWSADWETNMYGQLNAANDTDTVDQRFWWRLFDDRVLNQLMQLAREQNPTLRIAGLRILESRAALGIATSGRYPQVQQVTGAIGYANIQQFSGADQSLGNFQTGFDLGWELDFWGRFERGIESADAAFFASIFNQQNAQVLLAAQVADFYFAFRTAQLRIDIAKRNAAIQQRSYEITQKLYASGSNSELDLQQARTQYMATLSSIPALEITRTQLRNAIAALLGRPPGKVPELDGKLQPLPVMGPLAIEGIPANLLMRRPDIRAAAAQVATQSALVGVAETDLYPSVSLFGTVGWSSSTASATADTLSLGIGPSLSWNVFDYGRIKNNIRVQDARLQQAIEGFQNTVVQAAREIDDAAISVVKTGEQKLPQQQSTQAAKRSLELANKRYLEGYSDFQRVIEAQRALAIQSERELLNDSNHISAFIEFYKTIGGGWTPMTLPQMVPAQTLETMQSRTNWGDLMEQAIPVESHLLNPTQEDQDGD